MILSAERVAIPGRLDDITLSLRRGEVTAILGPNGAGKSTLLSVLAGLEAASACGTARLDGVDLRRMPSAERARAIGYLPQAGEAAWNVTVRTLVGLGRLPWRTGAEIDTAVIDRTLAELGLEHLGERALDRISGGERARALLGRVLAGTPQWVLADEPLASLDLASQLAMLVSFKRLAAESKGVVLVLHDLAQAMNHADRVIVLQAGRIAADGPPATALDPACIERVWGVKAHWLGEPGARALAL